MAYTDEFWKLHNAGISGWNHPAEADAEIRKNPGRYPYHSNLMKAHRNKFYTLTGKAKEDLEKKISSDRRAMEREELRLARDFEKSGAEYSARSKDAFLQHHLGDYPLQARLMHLNGGRLYEQPHHN
jgi:hypothetical protein